ncbi:xylulokinase [Clostridium algoriphilum]|uniref:xylulokinase n=1 Tax=Clostridium algoriphilum TaxID=198347 RepID=UPI001CF163E4|nr:xylulokinase [Clostridium algoriphilum]MCB2293038.1 xylulokinase [Clostridium algoriphilum]
MTYVLGIDIGTSGTKTILFDEKGNNISSAFKDYPLYQPEIRWAEQNPEDWWDAVVVTINSAIQKSGVDIKDIKGVGLSGQMHGLVMIDKEGKVLRPSIIWCDQRTTKECDEITKLVGAERLIEITANPALTGFTASKIMWVKKHEPETYKKTYKILLPKDYIRFMLTGEFCTEVSDASGMQLLDVPNRKWSDEVLEKLHIDKNLLGKVYESQEVTGVVNKVASKLTGLKEGTKVVGGAGDQAAGAVGNGIVRPGVISSTIGTSGVVFAHTDKVTIDKKGRVHTFCHAVPGAWHIMGVTQAAGLSLKWFKDNLCVLENQNAASSGIDVYEELNCEAGSVKPGVDGLMYLPYLMGERTPHLDPYARGVFFGLNARHNKNDMLRSVMEGVGYSLLDCMDIINEMGITVNEVRASGGGGKSEVWRQIQADMFNSEVVTINSSEGPALGVAILALVGVGVYSSVVEACDTIIHKVTYQNPINENVELYSKYHEIYKRLYTALKPEFIYLKDRIKN